MQQGENRRLRLVIFTLLPNPGLLFPFNFAVLLRVELLNVLTVTKTDDLVILSCNIAMKIPVNVMHEFGHIKILAAIKTVPTS